MAARPVLVFPRVVGGTQWAVKREGAKRVSSLHSTKEEALRAATITAKREGTEVEVHTLEGKITSSSSAVSDPPTSSYREAPSKPMTGRELYKILTENGLIGMWKDRTDIGDTLEFVQKLKDEGRERSQVRLRKYAQD